jgi:hypothetical protein
MLSVLAEKAMLEPTQRGWRRGHESHCQCQHRAREEANTSIGIGVTPAAHTPLHQCPQVNTFMEGMGNQNPFK